MIKVLNFLFTSFFFFLLYIIYLYIFNKKV
nr:MAG TPA: hypothetical protein [Caudoviricetes sp.]